MLSGNKVSRKILTWSEIRLDFLKANLRAIRARLGGSGTDLLAVVKADAYGHGMKAVASALKAEGVGFFGVANIEEAVDLREVCPRERILVLGSFHPSHVRDFIRHDITPTVSSLEDGRCLQEAHPAGRPQFRIHVKIDTGMGRLGLWHEDIEPFFRELKKYSSLIV
ncbi:MAG: alanine racemase, partial [Candidatus Omnitrophica bacterium]|nr:alanine racemase [Candidatus Omnitrophota bacterium]